MTWLINPYRFGGGVGGGDPYWGDVVFYLGMGAPGSAPVDLSLAARTITEVGTGPDFEADAGPVPGMSAWRVRRTAVDQSNNMRLTVDTPVGTELSGDFTIEVWAAHSNGSSYENCLFKHGNFEVAAYQSPSMLHHATLVKFSAAARRHVGELMYPAAWVHHCIERSGTTVRYYFNGQPSPVTETDSSTASATIMLGGYNFGGSNAQDWSGLIGPTRITRGIARYGGAPFVPGFTADGWMTATAPDFSPGPRKWWRAVGLTTNGASRYDAAEIEMRETLGGASINATYNATPTWSGSGGGSYANAFSWPDDNSPSTWTSTSLPAYATIDLKQPFAIRHLRLWCGTSVTPQAPTAWNLYYSDNGSSWALAYAKTGDTGWARYEARGYHLPDVGAHRYWRFEVTAVAAGAGVEMIEIGLAESAFGPTLSHRSAYGSICELNAGALWFEAFDSNTGTAWRTDSFTNGAWAGQRLTTAVTINEIRWWVSSGQQSYTPNTGRIESSHDGMRWQTEWSWSGLTWVSAEGKVISRP